MNRYTAAHREVFIGLIPAPQVVSVGGEVVGVGIVVDAVEDFIQVRLGEAEIAREIAQHGAMLGRAVPMRDVIDRVNVPSARPQMN